MRRRKSKMKEKLKNFYDKNKKRIQDVAIISAGAVIGWICCRKIYDSGTKDGIEVGLTSMTVLMEKAIEKNPNITVKEFSDKDFITGLTKEIIESYE